jgi:hypothetical protein
VPIRIHVPISHALRLPSRLDRWHHRLPLLSDHRFRPLSLPFPELLPLPYLFLFNHDLFGRRLVRIRASVPSSLDLNSLDAKPPATDRLRPWMRRRVFRI